MYLQQTNYFSPAFSLWSLWQNILVHVVKIVWLELTVVKKLGLYSLEHAFSNLIFTLSGEKIKID